MTIPGKMNPKTDFYFNKAESWRDEMELLRIILLDCGLTEELKWGCPCYTINQRNIVLIHSFKTYCALLFFKGALMQDPEGILITQTENVQSARQIRFSSLQEIQQLEPVLKTYVQQAVEVERSGKKIPLKKTEAFPVPDEFRQKMEEMPELKRAFLALTPGRQRAYLLHFAGAKQSQTRLSRIEKNVERILEGKGIDER